MSKDNSRKIELAATVSTVFGKKYLFLKIGKVSHSGGSFTPSGNTFTNGDFEIISEARNNFTETALVLPPSSSESQILIFTNQPRAPKGTVFVKNLEAYLENIKSSVKAYNEQFSENYEFSKSLAEGEELIS
jgi:hypothetical protein